MNNYDSGEKYSNDSAETDAFDGYDGSVYLDSPEGENGMEYCDNTDGYDTSCYSDGM